MRKKRKPTRRKSNPVARALRSPAHKRRIERPKKGKGSYRRKKRLSSADEPD